MFRLGILLAMLSMVTSGQQPQPDVHLNHAFIVPDAETYEAIRNSDFVKQFAVWEERTTHRKDITYTGFYLYGRHTYFEFLKPDERTPVGTSKIAFGVDRTGDLDLLQKRAEAAGMKTEIKTITRAFNGKDVDWFRSLDTKGENKSSLGIWTLEYVPTFLTEWNPKANEKPNVRREDVLKRYAEVAKQKPGLDMVEDVATIWLSTSMSFDQIRSECEVLGFNVGRIDNNIVCASFDLTLVFKSATEQLPPGVKAIAFRLHKKPPEPFSRRSRKKRPEKNVSIGKTVLNIDDEIATWIFQPGFQPFSRGDYMPERK